MDTERREGEGNQSAARARSRMLNGWTDGIVSSRSGRRRRGAAGGDLAAFFCCFVVSASWGISFFLSTTAHFLGTHTQDTTHYICRCRCRCLCCCCCCCSCYPAWNLPCTYAWSVGRET
jgi:hypothetical protein